MLTNQEPGVSAGHEPSADELFTRMGELDDQQSEIEEQADSDQPNEQSYESAPVEDELEEIDHDGKKYKIPKAIKPALMFQSDYTKKTQALAEQRKAFEQHAQAVQAERQYYANQLSGFVEQLAQSIQQGPSEEQLKELSIKDPIAYIQAKAERDIKMAQFQQAQQQQQQIQYQQSQENQRKMGEYVQSERATLLDKVPEWKDKAVFEKETSELANYAQSLGYGQDELAELYDHRAYLVLRDAMRYRQLLSSKESQAKQVQAQPPRVLKPGAAAQPAQPDGKKVPDNLIKAFHKAPTVQYMAHIFEKLG